MSDMWVKLINVDPPSMNPISDASRENTKKYALKFRGAVRVSLGKFSTDAEHEARRIKSLNTPLP
jgi:hypothetical protein